MKVKLSHEPWIRYRCDGPKCNPGITNIKEFPITPDCTFGQVDIPTDKHMRDRTIPIDRKPDIVDYGWRRIVINEQVCHICPECYKHILEKFINEIVVQIGSMVDTRETAKVIAKIPFHLEDLL